MQNRKAIKAKPILSVFRYTFQGIYIIKMIPNIMIAYSIMVQIFVQRYYKNLRYASFT